MESKKDTSKDSEEQEEPVEVRYDENKGSNSGGSEAHDVIHSDNSHQKWPTLYEECQSMVSASILIYAIADLRKRIRAGEINDPSITEPYMHLPGSAQTLLPVAQENPELFQKTLGVEGDENYLELLLKARQAKGLPPEAESTMNENVLWDDWVILEIHDEKSDREIVYAIVLNQ